MSWANRVARRVLALLAAVGRGLREHAHTTIFSIGFVALERGIAVTFTPGIAAIVGGVVLMFLGAWPFLRPRRA